MKFHKNSNSGSQVDSLKETMWLTGFRYFVLYIQIFVA